MNIQDYIELAEKAIKHPPKWRSKAFNLLAEDNWSNLGTHERTDHIKKLKEQPRLHPTDPKTFESGGGGQ